MRVATIVIILLSVSCANDTVLDRMCGNIGNQCYAVWNDDPGKFRSPGIYSKDYANQLHDLIQNGTLKGECALGIPKCDNPDDDTEITDCVGEVLPEDEICDLKDNNCNGYINEHHSSNINPLLGSGDDNVCLKHGPCAKGVSECINGHFICTVQPTYEICNGIDDDCNARIDDEIGNEVLCFDDEFWKATNGTCRAGVERCIDGEMRCDEQILPSPELCDDLDNDCNGIKDDTGDVLSTKYDIVLGVDDSGSMCDEIGAVAGALDAYMDQFAGNLNFRWAVVSMNYEMGNFVEVLLDFSDISDAQSLLLASGCSGMGYEASMDLLYDVCEHMNSDLALSWRHDANALLFSFTDEPPQSYEDPKIDDLMIIDSCITNGVLPIQWGPEPDNSGDSFSGFKDIVEPANGAHFFIEIDNVSKTWEEIFNDLNSVVVTLCQEE